MQVYEMQRQRDYGNAARKAGPLYWNSLNQKMLSSTLLSTHLLPETLNPSPSCALMPDERSFARVCCENNSPAFHRRLGRQLLSCVTVSVFRLLYVRDV